MGLVTKIVFLALTAGSAFITFKLFQTDPVPIVEDEYWGPISDQGKKEDTTVRPFKINISETILDDLKTRLKRELDSNRLLAPLEGVGFEYGFNSKFLNTVGQHWLKKYDWRTREKLLNKYPHFKTKIGGLDIHFQHVKPGAKNGNPARPLLIIHGWPGSVIEFQKIIPLLSEPKDSIHNYELIIPSLPGYGFSSPAARRGMDTVQIANIFKRLMKRLGHDKFFVMGGDWGAAITTDIATVYSQNVIAAQSNWCHSLTRLAPIRFALATLFPNFLMTPEMAKAVMTVPNFVSQMVRETGYAHIHATKPDTIGVGLTHSPLGLAAYILEKFSTWTNKEYITREDGGFLENYTMDELLDNVMVYWVTGSMTSSVRIYAEVCDPNKKYRLENVPTEVPFSCQFMRNELMITPEFGLSDKYRNLQKVTVLPNGGHFAAFELPEIVANDAVALFDKY